jgi:uncharacterized SAM-binding protein YcdF (DUF218 family)
MLAALTIQLCPFRKKENRPEGGLAAMLCFAVYSVAGNNFIAEALARALEAPYRQINPLDDPPDVVIVLGGGGTLGANGRLQGNGSGDRLILAAQLYHQHPSTKFICTGQRIVSMNATGIDPADTSRDILVRLGVPASSIEISGGRNTSEEMQHLAKRFEASHQTIGLLTSAWHLPRATRLATRIGLTTIPLPADFRSSPPNNPLTTGQWIEAVIPNGSAFASTWSFAKEYLGMAVGR